MIAAALAAGVDPARAAAAAAWLHAECARSSVDEGVVAGDLVDRLPAAIAAMRDPEAVR
jgi:NAD(P)H-hydrate repair Nnr-like enzyme with NAD(P)H-hydrate dehydratase domain